MQPSTRPALFVIQKLVDLKCYQEALTVLGAMAQDGGAFSHSVLLRALGAYLSGTNAVPPRVPDCPVAPSLRRRRCSDDASDRTGSTKAGSAASSTGTGRKRAAHYETSSDESDAFSLSVRRPAKRLARQEDRELEAAQLPLQQLLCALRLAQDVFFGVSAYEALGLSREEATLEQLQVLESPALGGGVGGAQIR